jgi:hypothetical protein
MKDGKPTKRGPLETIIPVTDLAMVQQLCALFSALIPRLGQDSLTPTPNTFASVSSSSSSSSSLSSSSSASSTAPQTPATTLASLTETKIEDTQMSQRRTITELIRDPEIVESVFIFCLVWSIGGALRQDARQDFDKFLGTYLAFP